MELSKEDQIAVIESLEKKKILFQCKECNSKMTVDSKLFSLLNLELVNGSANLSNLNFKPLICMYCLNCGATKQFDISVLIGRDPIIE